MNTHDRQSLIAARVAESGEVSVAELVADLGASEATVRRDLAELDARGEVRRVHGGARRLEQRGHDPGFAAREAANADGKRRIARAVSDLLRPGEAVVLDSGTTCLEVARVITGPARVVPLSLPVVQALAGRVEMTLPGGELRSGELSFAGPLTERALSQLRVDTAVISPCAFSLDLGATAYDLSDAAVKQAAMRAAARRVLLCDRSKWDRAAFAWFADLDDIDLLVTDHEITGPEAERLAAHDVEVVAA